MVAPLFSRQAGEGGKAFSAFSVYRSLPPQHRSLRAVAELVGKSRQLIERWCSRYRWVARVQAWDNEQEQARCRAHLRAVEEMSARHAALALLAQQRAAERLSQMTSDDIAAMGVSDICALLRLAEGIERRARGVGTAVGGMLVRPRPGQQDRSTDSDSEGVVPTLTTIRERAQKATSST
jgi:hypothetical protein